MCAHGHDKLHIPLTSSVVVKFTLPALFLAIHEYFPLSETSILLITREPFAYVTGFELLEVPTSTPFDCQDIVGVSIPVALQCRTICCPASTLVVAFGCEWNLGSAIIQ